MALSGIFDRAMNIASSAFGLGGGNEGALPGGGWDEYASTALPGGGGQADFSLPGGGGNTDYGLPGGGGYAADFSLPGGGGGGGYGLPGGRGGYAADFSLPGGGGYGYDPTMADEARRATLTLHQPPPGANRPSASPYAGTGQYGGQGTGAQGSWGVHEGYRELITKYAQMYGIDPDAAAAFAKIETGHLPADQVAGATSHAGAMGVLQVMDFHFAPGENPYDPETNIRVGLRYFAEMYKRFGNYGLAAAAYHGGSGAIRNGVPRNDNSDGHMTSAQYAEQWQRNYAAIKATAPPTAPNGTGNWMQAAQSLIGNPYQLGGRRANGGRVGPGIPIDCSEFTGYLLEQEGIKLPWNAQQQYNLTTRVAQGQWQPGDLIFFHSTYAGNPGEDVTHVGRFVGYDAGGNPIMVHAGGSRGVEYANLNDPYYRQHYYGAGRVNYGAAPSGTGRY